MMDTPTTTHMTMSRIRDFDDQIVTTEIDLEYKNVRVRTVSWKDSLVYSELRKKNSESIDPYRIVDNSKLRKITCGIDYNGSPAGEITIWNIKDSSCMISYWVDESVRRNKIATYSVALITDYCFLELGVEEVEAPVLEENEASKNLLMKLSYSIAGYETFTGADGIQRAHETYLILKPENGIAFSLIDFLEMMAQPPAE
jgi:hypothetical protein